MTHFIFKSLNKNDLPLLYLWFQEPIINQSYASGKQWSQDKIREKYEPRILGKEYIPSHIIYQRKKPIGFIQYYFLENNLPEGIRDHNNGLFKQYKPNELAGMDLLIAENNLRGKGYGKQIITKFIDHFLSKFSAVVVDPAIDNVAALSCYKKAGFMHTTFGVDPSHNLLIKPL